MAQKVICILGMHRSGTSCLAGSLEAMGLNLGEVITWARYNRKGNRENPRIMELHEAVLEANNGSWDRPPESVHWNAAHKARRDEILADYANAESWGFKDPRTLFTLDGWLEVIDRIEYVGTFRHPGKVAESLLSRNKGERSHWLNLWYLYNARLLALHDSEPFPIIDFDLDEEVYGKKVEIMVQSLGITPRRDQIGGQVSRGEDEVFFDPKLRTSGTPADMDLPKPVAALYQELCARAL